MAPENTIVAFGRAVEEGADAVELDVRLTRDGHAVVLHDPTVTTPDGRVLWVSRLTLKEVQSLDAGSWFAPEFAGTRVPTLREVVQWARGRCLLDIDLKASGFSSERLIGEVVRLLREEGTAESAFCVSFNPWALRRLTHQAPEIPAGLLYLRDLPGSPFLRFWQKVSAARILLPEKGLASERHVAWIHGRGVPAIAWIVNDPSQAVLLAQRGVDGLITDDVPALRRALANRRP